MADDLVKRLREKAFRAETYEMLEAAADRIEMIEASRAQELLLVQGGKIDRLENVVKQLELKLVGLSVRNTQLETALRKIALHPDPYLYNDEMAIIARKALEGKDD
jgi:hypothetical protein